MRRTWISVVLSVMTAVASGQQPGTASADHFSVDGLIQSLADPAAAARLDHGRGRFASFTRQTTKAEVDGFRGTQMRGRRAEYVMVEVEGPGVLVSLRMTPPKGRLIIVVDGRAEATIDIDAEPFFTGQVTLSSEPFASPRDGTTIHFPMPYAASLLVACTDPDVDWEVECRQFPKDTKLVPFSDAKSGAIAHFRAAAAIAALKQPASVAPAFHVFADGGGRMRDDAVLAKVAPGAAMVLFERETKEPAAIRCLTMALPGGADASSIPDGVRLVIDFDGRKASVDAPINLFFGGRASGPWSSFVMGQQEGVIPERRCSFVMPFREKVRARLVNDGGVEFSGAVFRVLVEPFAWTDDTAYFGAAYLRGTAGTTTVAGSGRYVGYAASWPREGPPFRERFRGATSLESDVAAPAATRMEAVVSGRESVCWPFSYRGAVKGSPELWTAFRWRGLDAVDFNDAMNFMLPDEAELVAYYYVRPLSATPGK